MRVIMAAIAVSLLSGFSHASPNGEDPYGFHWPETQAGALPDLRLAEIIASARGEERDAKARAREARQAAAQARRRTSARAFIGLETQAVTVDSGTVMRAMPYYGEDGPMLGEISYATGAKMTGVFGPDIGVFVSAPEAPVAEFRGWVQHAVSADPNAMVGVFDYRNGERFSGCYCAGSNARGAFESADGGRRFIGQIDLTGERPRPLQGIVEDKRGRLLAVVLGE